MPDEELFEKGYNRVYDTLEMEKNLNAIDEFVRAAARPLDPTRALVERDHLPRSSARRSPRWATRPGILRSAYLHDVPVYVPAFTDSEMGLDVATWMLRKTHAEHGNAPDFDVWKHATAPSLQPLPRSLELRAPRRHEEAARHLHHRRRRAAQLGAAGRALLRHRRSTASASRSSTRASSYGVRICPEPVHWGGLSGCTYSEGVSWGKFVPASEGGRFAEVYADATVAWPLLVRAVLERLGKIDAPHR